MMDYLSFFFMTKVRHLNIFLLTLLIVIACIGFATLYSAGGGTFFPWAQKQMIRFGAGFVVMLLIAFVDIRRWLSLSYGLYGLSLILLIGVEIVGRIGMGAQRWIDLYFFHLQPSEIMKVTLLMALARYFHGMKPHDVRSIKKLILPFLCMVVPAILVLRQPDLGTAVILLCGGMSILWVAGMPRWLMTTGFLSLCGALPFLWSCLHGYQKERVLTFLNPERDPLGAGYHILQSSIALGSGGLFGKGFLDGSQSRLNFLPEKQTDFIFAMYCEEFGVLGGILLIVLYSLMIAISFSIAHKSRHVYGRLLGMGLTSLLFFYVFINIAMVMGLLPVVGIPLPLMSYGGTAMLTVMMSIGLLLSISLYRDVRIGRSRGFL